jgi:hypothetical protein
MSGSNLKGRRGAGFESRVPQSSTIFNCIWNFASLPLQQISSGKTLKSCGLDEHKHVLSEAHLKAIRPIFSTSRQRSGLVGVNAGRAEVCNANRAILWKLESQARLCGRGKARQFRKGGSLRQKGHAI